MFAIDELNTLVFDQVFISCYSCSLFKSFFIHICNSSPIEVHGDFHAAIFIMFLTQEFMNHFDKFIFFIIIKCVSNDSRPCLCDTGLVLPIKKALW